MRFEVAYPSGVRNEVELEGTVALLGRDPSCDLVLNDVKCSRKHAIVEAGPDGMLIRDNGSANGIYVNGHKVDQAPLNEGDKVRLGQIVLTVLAEDFAPTVAMDPSELERPSEDAEETEPIQRAQVTPPPRKPPRREPTSPPGSTPSRGTKAPRISPPGAVRPAPPPPAAGTFRPPAAPAGAAARPSAPQRPAPRPPSARGPAGLIPRPPTVTMLAGLWMLGVLVYGGLGIGLAFTGGWSGPMTALVAFSGVALAALSAAVGFGLWTLAPWGRVLQLGLAGLGVLTCVGTLPSLAILVYALRPEVQIVFSGAGDFRRLAPQDAEKLRQAPSDVPWAVGILVTLVVSAVLAALLGWGAYWYLDLGNPASR